MCLSLIQYIIHQLLLSDLSCLNILLLHVPQTWQWTCFRQSHHNTFQIDCTVNLNAHAVPLQTFILFVLTSWYLSFICDHFHAVQDNVYRVFFCNYLLSFAKSQGTTIFYETEFLITYEQKIVKNLLSIYSFEDRNHSLQYLHILEPI